MGDKDDLDLDGEYDLVGDLVGEYDLVGDVDLGRLTGDEALPTGELVRTEVGILTLLGEASLILNGR